MCLKRGSKVQKKFTKKKFLYFQKTHKKKSAIINMKISITILSLFVASTIARPQGDLIIFRDDYDDNISNRPELVPAPNNTAKFITHPEARASLEYGHFFQGDMNLTPEQEQFYASNSSNDDEDTGESYGLLTRTGIINTKYRWPKDASGKINVPYKIDSAAGYCEFFKFFSLRF